MSTGFRKIATSASLLLAVLFCSGTDQAVARTLYIGGKTYTNVPNSFPQNAASKQPAFKHTQPTTLQGVNKSSPSAVGGFLSHYQPNNNSAGGYFPWMTQNPYGMPMRGNPAARAVCANGACGSDIRLKTDIVRLGQLDNGIALYRFRYIDDDRVFVGVMAQEVRGVVRGAVTRGRDGFLRVNYSRLGLRMQTWEEWTATSGG